MQIREQKLAKEKSSEASEASKTKQKELEAKKREKLNQAFDKLQREITDLYLFTYNIQNRTFFDQRQKTRLITKRHPSSLVLKKKMDESSNAGRYLELQSILEVKRGTSSKLTNFMKKKLLKMREKINKNNDFLSKLLPYARISSMLLEKKTGKNDELFINIFHPFLFDKRADKGEYLIPVQGFRRGCEAILGWKLKNGKNSILSSGQNGAENGGLEGVGGGQEGGRSNVMLEIVTMIDGLKIVRIGCQRLLEKTKDVQEDVGDREWVEIDPSGALEKVKILEYLLRISNKKLFEFLARRYREPLAGAERRSRGGKRGRGAGGVDLKKKGSGGESGVGADKVVLFHQNGVIQVSLKTRGLETAYSDEDYKFAVRILSKIGKNFE